MVNPSKELHELVSIVVKEGASDLHMSVGAYPTLRIAGNLIPLVKRPVLTAEDTRVFLEILISKEKINIFEEKKEIDFSYMTEEAVRFRGNAFFQQRAVGIALRLIPVKIPTLQELNLPPILEKFTRIKQGFFMVVGPVGHGKSTTLASLLNLVNKERTEHIITIEDPIEYLFKKERSIIDQREIGIDTRSFHAALTSMFRQDIDIIMLGEMRDSDTISTAVTAAETGHLVFSTLHTNNAAQTIDRIIDSFPADGQNQIRTQLSQSLVGIFSQRLIPRISGGLIPAYELLINNDAIGNLIRESQTHGINLVIETSSSEGMITLDRSLVDLVRRGEITQEHAHAYSLDPRGLENLMR